MYRTISPLFGMAADSLGIDTSVLVECIVKLHQKANGQDIDLTISVDDSKAIVADFFMSAKANAEDDSIRSVRKSMTKAIFDAYRKGKDLEVSSPEEKMMRELNNQMKVMAEKMKRMEEELAAK